MEKITYNLDTVKDKVKVFIKKYYYDFCTDMLSEIKSACDQKSIDDIEMHINSIRRAEAMSIIQVEQVDNAQCVTDILLIASDDNIGNVLFEQEDILLSVILDIKIEQQWPTI